MAVFLAIIVAVFLVNAVDIYWVIIVAAFCFRAWF
jgi:hypothetical protein